jgi:hypothetical protein
MTPPAPKTNTSAAWTNTPATNGATREFGVIRCAQRYLSRRRRLERMSTSLRGRLCRTERRQRDHPVADAGRPAQVAAAASAPTRWACRRSMRCGVRGPSGIAGAGQAHQRVDARLRLHLDHRCHPISPSM